MAKSDQVLKEMMYRGILAGTAFGVTVTSNIMQGNVPPGQEDAFLQTMCAEALKIFEVEQKRHISERGSSIDVTIYGHSARNTFLTYVELLEKAILAKQFLDKL